MRWTLVISAILLATLAAEPRTAWGQSSSSGMFGGQSLARACRPGRGAPLATPSARALALPLPSAPAWAAAWEWAGVDLEARRAVWGASARNRARVSSDRVPANPASSA